MKTVSVSLDEPLYEELTVMLENAGQTKQMFYETLTKIVLRENSIPFSVNAPVPVNGERNRMAAFRRLESLRKKNEGTIDYDQERENALNEKYGVID